jgi:hypothetical protein
MKLIYHKAITLKALNDRVTPYAARVIVRANQGQDGLVGLLRHPEYHFNNTLSVGLDYLEQQREVIFQVLNHTIADPDTTPLIAWKALGRLFHAIQDFYAHSNYVRLWVDLFAKETPQSPDQIDPVVEEIMTHPDLGTGKVYFLEQISYPLFFIRPFSWRFLPHDAHLHMNLDHPGRGPLFAYAFTAARKRTKYEFERILKRLSPDQQMLFCGDVSVPAKDTNG